MELPLSSWLPSASRRFSRQPLPQEASTPDEYETIPTEREDEHLAKLLSGNGEYEEGDDSEIGF